MALAFIAAAGDSAFAQSANAWSLHDALDAPGNLKLSGSFRLRYETLEGQFRPGANPTDDLTSLRTIITGEYKNGPLRFGAELYDSRAYGGRMGGAIGTGEVNTFEFVQAYVAADIAQPFGPDTSADIQAGRFQANLGSRRFISADDYRNTPNAYTGVWSNLHIADGTALTLLYTMPQVRLPDDLPSILDNKFHFDRESTDLVLWGGALARPLADKLSATLTFLTLEEKDAPGRPTRDRHLRTVSGWVVRTPAPEQFDYEAEFAYQYGSIRNGVQANASLLDVSASFLHIHTGYQFADSWKSHLSLEYDYVSGDDGKASYGRFDALFGSRRTEFGPSGIYTAIGRANIDSPVLRWEVTPSPRWDGFVAWHGLWLASASDSFSNTGIRDLSGRAGAYAGQQIEGRIRYWLVPDRLRAELDGALLFKGAALENAPNAPHTGDTHYVSFNLTAPF